MPEEESVKKSAVSAEALAAARLRARKRQEEPCDPCIRAENEDDDGYDPYSDRRPEREPLFAEDPWR